MDDNNKFPKIEKAITDFLNDEDGNITRNRLVTIGSLILLMSILSIDTVSAHESHSSHSSHESHSSTSYIRDHTNHVSHSDHGSHSSHTSHSSATLNPSSGLGEEANTDALRAESVPVLTTQPVDDSVVFDYEINEDILVDNASEADNALLNTKIPYPPDVEDAGFIQDTGLSFNKNLGEKIAAGVALVGGTGTIATAGVGAAKMVLDKNNDSRKRKTVLKYQNTYAEEDIQNKVEELKEQSSLEICKQVVVNISDEDIIKGKIELNEIIDKIDNLQKALDSNPEQKESIERFTCYFIPETIGIVMTYIKYVKDGAPEENQNIILNKAKESLNALKEAIEEKINNVYQYSTMDTIAKAEALSRILSQNGYKKDKDNF